MTRSNVPLLVKQPSSLAGNNGLYLSRSVSTKQSGWLMQERACMYSVQTSPRYHAAAVTSDLKQRLLTRGQAYHKTSSTKQLVNGKSDYVQVRGKRTSLWISAKLKPAPFQSQYAHYTQTAIFGTSEPPTV